MAVIKNKKRAANSQNRAVHKEEKEGCKTVKKRAANSQKRVVHKEEKEGCEKEG